MKCYECESLKTDKLKEPCCSCIGRPHDLCCGDNFKPAKPVVLTPTDLLTMHLKAWDGKPHDSAFLINLILRSGQNYRLERDLELRPLVEVCRSMPRPVRPVKMERILKNLPPLDPK